MHEHCHLLNDHLLPLQLLFQLVNGYLLLRILHSHLVVRIYDVYLLLFEHIDYIFSFLDKEVNRSPPELTFDSTDLIFCVFFNMSFF